MAAASSIAYPFSPLVGSTISFTAAASIPAAVQCLGPGVYLVQNTSTSNIILLGWGTTSGAASTAAGVTANTLPLLPGSIQIITLSPNLWFTGSSLASSLCYITAGYGI